MQSCVQTRHDTAGANHATQAVHRRRRLPELGRRRRDIQASTGSAPGGSTPWPPGMGRRGSNEAIWHGQCRSIAGDRRDDLTGPGEAVAFRVVYRFENSGGATRAVEMDCLASAQHDQPAPLRINRPLTAFDVAEADEALRMAPRHLQVVVIGPGIDDPGDSEVLPYVLRPQPEGRAGCSCFIATDTVAAGTVGRDISGCDAAG